MQTANEPRSRKSTMTSEAYNLLDCFVAGLDDVIYDIAEAVAAAHGRVVDDVVEITDDDVRFAADAVFRAIRDEAGKSIPEAAAKQIEEMHECVLEKCRIQKAGK